jgi:ABC-type antimicrobial peptide transport system permease subunit
MTFKSFVLILQRQFTQKWGRFLLASGGIMIGVWAITLTSSLSFGLSDTIVKAINSQAVAREIRIYQTPDKKTSFSQIQEAPTFVPISRADLEKIQSKNESIQGVSPSELIGFYLLKDNTTSCLDQIQANKKAILGNSKEIPNDAQISEALAQNQEFRSQCPVINYSSNVFEYFYQTNKTNWYGKTSAPTQGEIAVCFECGSLEFNKIFNATEPNDLLNKEITLEYKQAPNALDANVAQSVLDFQNETEITESKTVKFKIVAVVDDRDANSFSFTGGSLNFYTDFSYFEEAIKLRHPEKDVSKVGYLENIVYLKDYNDVDKAIEAIQKDGYLAFSITQAVVSGVKTAFSVLTAVLSGFGLIALVASVFGIINVITISVLERKKEIGILKSLGARDGDIFRVFLFESMSLGVIGWLLGTFISVVSGFIVSSIFNFVFTSNKEWKENLEALNITEFSPSFPWWLLLSTLGLALVFTILSGVYPAIKASKQNPVDVLRSE